ncbi:cobalt-precorrin-6A reductase [Motilibacter aurantiacus]|uniref:cobalt-precorrin-6A reductase n=1 Tax=Motilibacter aurantiacus TaxID=2714955 RepID=UPI001409D3D1|nr:cobalt-precorrin-6A reductase [Motilibacter aurantiacus]NHC46158.1 cobalt-precorrin-6A reductase [Motilibacter aurantiacus]
MTVLLLGGTAEARDLAERLGRAEGVRVVSSLAGRTAAPHLPAGDVRVGGLGGADGLRAWVAAHSPAAVVDATHPFAEAVSRAAATAADGDAFPLLRLERPGWTQEPGDRWHRVPSLAAAADLAPSLGRRPFLTTGRQGLETFIGHPSWGGLDVLVRTVDPPAVPLPARFRLRRDRGPYALDGELGLLRSEAVDVVVTKDSGGTSTAAKLAAARALALPVVMVERPVLPPVARAESVDAAAAWVSALLI